MIKYSFIYFIHPYYHPHPPQTSVVRAAAQLVGAQLVEFSMNSSVDTMELLGGYEQLDLSRHAARILGAVAALVSRLTAAVAATAAAAAGAVSVAITAPLSQLHDAWWALQTASKAAAESHVALSAQQLGLLELVLSLAERVGSQAPSLVLAAGLEDAVSHASTRTVEPSVPSIRAAVATLRAQQATSATGRFEWCDGLLVDALQRGAWLLLDNINLCSGAVLDRLNSLLEPGGSLLLAERGLVGGKLRAR